MALALMTMSAFGASIKYNGGSLTQDSRFTRSQCGTAKKSVCAEVSGMACSRTTPGYLWIHGDENTSGESGAYIGVRAIQPSGTLAMSVSFSNVSEGSRDDWEDICTGVYNNKNYVFVGAFGDNEGEYNDNYIIYYFEEPAITSGSKSIAVNYIKFGYPDNKAHNTETLMYDNIEQMLYVVDKVKGGVCTLYKLPFATNYGTSVQKLTEVQKLGQSGDNFDYCTAGDISPDGKWMIIKNKPFALIWERQGNESLTATVARAPKQIAAYKEEEQGESVAWLNDSIFYTTSDSKSDTPIYKYVIPATEQGGEGEEQGGEQGEGGGDTPFVPISDDPTCDIIYDLQNNVGIYELGGTTTVGEGGKVAGSKPAKAVKFGNSFTSTKDNVTTYHYIKISPLQGGFQAGDSIVITGYIKSGDNSKHGAVAVYTSIDGQPIYTSENFMDSEIDTESMPSAQSFVLTENADELYLGRSGNTSTYLLEIKVYRKKDSEATALQATKMRSVATKVMRNGRIYLRHGQQLFDAQGRKL